MSELGEYMTQSNEPIIEVEIWKDIEGFEGVYQVSNKAQVRSLDKKVNGGRSGLKLKKGKILSQVKSDGYWKVVLHNNGVGKNMRVHRLMAMAFISNPDNKPFINHIDGNRGNNNLDNLEWCTGKENTDHLINVLGYQMSDETLKKIRIKLIERGEKSRKPVRCIEDNKIFSCASEAASYYGATRCAIRFLIKNKGKSRYGKTFEYA